MSKLGQIIPDSFVDDIKAIIGQARTQAVRSIEYHRVQMYWKLGERIFTEEQQGKERAEYGSYLIRNLAEQLEPEFGNGFSFVARQKRFLIEDDEFFADLVFYNRLLRCFVVIEIKTQKITHQDLGQLQMYVNYYDCSERLPSETPTIGILLCASKNNEMVKMALPQNNQTILASQYKLYLPTESQLLAELKKEFENDRNW